MRKALSFLGNMNESDIEWLVRNGSKRRLAKGAVLIAEGQPADSLFFVLKGRLAVSTRTASEVTALETGEVVGETSFVDARPATASVTALEECEVGVVPQRSLTVKLAQDMAFAAHFYRSIAIVLADRLRAATAIVGGKHAELSEDIEGMDELGAHLLGTMSVAGARFAEIQRRSWGGGAS